MTEPVPGMGRCLLTVPRVLEDKLLSLDWDRNLSSVVVSLAWPYQFDDGMSRRLVATRGQFLEDLKKSVQVDVGFCTHVIEMNDLMVVLNRKDRTVLVRSRYDFATDIWKEYFKDGQFNKASLFLQRAIKSKKINSLDTLKSYVKVLKKIKVVDKLNRKSKTVVRDKKLKSEDSFEIEES